MMHRAKVDGRRGGRYSNDAATPDPIVQSLLNVHNGDVIEANRSSRVPQHPCLNMQLLRRDQNFVRPPSQDTGEHQQRGRTNQQCPQISLVVVQ
jgi:hypothetical protein